MTEQELTQGKNKGLWSWAFYDWANSAYPAVIQTFVFAAYFTRQIAENETLGSSQWGNTISIAGLTVALLGPFLGAVADQGGRRKPWLAVFTLLCIIPTALLSWAYPSNEVLYFALAMVALSTIGSEFSFVFYNAMLPDLVSSKKMGRWSGWAWGLGYAGGLVCLIVALYGLINPEAAWLGLSTDQAEHVRATFVLVAIWYAIFALPLFLNTPDRPSTFKSMRDSVRDGWLQIKESVQHVREYKDILRFLLARMFFIDGLATVFAFGGIYAAGAFDMTEKDVLIFGIGLNVTAGLGAAAFAWLDDALGSKTTINMALIGLIISCSSILLVSSISLFWTFGLILGLFVGPVQAASRTYMAHLAPQELRTQMFGLFALSGKVTAFMGPFLVGQLTLFSGSQRVGMTVIVAFFILGALLMRGLPSVKAADVV
jgi:UMF1 family MFS transporter